MAWHRKTKADVLAKIKELQQEAAQFDRRNKSLAELKKWMANRKLDYTDMRAMLLEMKPVRADKPVKSKKPLQPNMNTGRNGGHFEVKGDPEFRRAIQEARLAKNLTTIDLGKKIGLSNSTVSNWEQGRNVPTNLARLKILKILELPEHLGAEASKGVVRGNNRHRQSANGRAQA